MIGIVPFAHAQGPTCDVELELCEAVLEETDDALRSLGRSFEEIYAENLRLLAAGSAYEDLRRDLDGDAVLDRFDSCPGTEASLDVDGAGCSLGQFCRASPVVTRRDRRICRRLDWKNDEPTAGVPGDCRWDREAGRCSNAFLEPVAPAGCPDTFLTISIGFEVPLGGIAVFVQYDPDLVTMPGSGNEALLQVENLNAGTGLFNAGDSDVDGDGVDERLAVALISPFSTIEVGAFARARFDCAAGAGRQPIVSDFTCTVDASTSTGNRVPASCALAVTSAPE